MVEQALARKIVILNGAPRSGKSSIAAEIQRTFAGVWMNFGVDQMMQMTPERYQPGIGLRPGGERPDLEPMIVKMYLALYRSVAAISRSGLNVVVNIGHHDGYSEPLKILPQCAQILKDFPVLFVGVRCPIEEIMERRARTWGMGYDKNGDIPTPVLLWQQLVHEPGIYDLEVDTLGLSPEECPFSFKGNLREYLLQTLYKK